MKKYVIILAAAMLVTFLAAGMAEAADTPEQVYQKFVEAVRKSDYPSILKYTTKKNADELKAMPETERTQVLKFIQMMTPKNCRITGTQNAGNMVTLFAEGDGTDMLTGKPEKQYGKIEMVKEDGEWKVHGEHWSNTKEK